MSDETNKKQRLKIKTEIGIQFWSTYTFGQSQFDEENQKYIPVSDRWNNQIRRTRISLKGNLSSNLKFKLTASADLVGRDVLSATQGGFNNGANPRFGLWNAHVRWKAIKQSDLLHVTAGYMVPQIGRESVTGALRSTSFEKSWSQNYLRRSLVGTGPGRTMGLNFGGQKRYIWGGLQYDVGLYTPVWSGLEGNSIGQKATHLTVGRLRFFIGDPENSNYALGHKINYFGKRKGVSLSVARSHQGETDLFVNNRINSIDWLINYGVLNLDGEWSWLKRGGMDRETKFDVGSNTGYVRLGVNLSIKKNRYLEPVFMLRFFRGPLDLISQQYAARVNAFAGHDDSVSFGFNYHLNSSDKISFFYTYNSGSYGDAEIGGVNNNYFYQKGAGQIERGNLLGVALVYVIS